MPSVYKVIILPEWTVGGHLTIGKYLDLFDRATDELRQHVALGRDYVAATNRTMYVVEAHLTYGKEVRADDAISIATRVLDVAPRKCHLFHEMRAPGGGVASTCEMVIIHVDRQSGRAAPLPEAGRTALLSAFERDAALPWPAAAGRAISFDIPR